MPHKPRIVSTCYKNHLNSFHNKIKAPTSKSFCMLVVGWRSKSSRDKMLMLMMMTDSEEDFFFCNWTFDEGRILNKSKKYWRWLWERRWRIQKHRKHFMSISQIINCFWSHSRNNNFVAFSSFRKVKKKIEIVAVVDKCSVFLMQIKQALDFDGFRYGFI